MKLSLLDLRDLGLAADADGGRLAPERERTHEDSERDSEDREVTKESA
jgi:hypothetical protein